jgi:SAM-dependent methyltransferase
MQPESKYSYFQIQSLWGVTKHFGGVRVTEELAGLCHIDASAYVLEVGSGVGFTACHLAQKTGCRVMGVDLSEKMVAWAQKRAARKGLEERCQFRVADAQQLPFEDGSFDAMLCESVTAFVPDKRAALSEYHRVVKPGGFVGLNEGTWVRGNPPDEFLAFIRRAMGGVDFLQPEEWRALLEGSGLTEISAQVYEMNAIRQRRDEIQGMDAQDWLQRIQAIGTAMGLSIKDPEFRNYVKSLVPSRKVMGEMFEYLGYGLYVGRV